MGKYGYGKCNDRGEAVLKFAPDNDMVIWNTLFQQKECGKWTWRSPNQHTTNMIDLIYIHIHTYICHNDACVTSA